MTKTYVVEWAIDIEADSPQEAAAKALIVQRDNDPFNTATVFNCIDESGEQHQVDITFLAEEKAAEPEPVKAYKIQVGRDARQYFDATTVGSLSKIMDQVSNYGFKGTIEEDDWVDCGVDYFDAVETVVITDPDTEEVVAAYSNGDGWDLYGY